MNYLAHVFLSHDTPEAVTGALLGDFVKGRAAEDWPPRVRDAILLHRAIDRFTDSHPIHRMSCALVSRERRRFAGVLVDVFYDHFLARHWARYCETGLEEFTASVYAVLLPQRASFPERLQRMLPYMAADDWLASYAEIESVDAALNGIARRFRRFPRAQVLTTAIEELERDYARFEAHFLAFFPELQQFVAAQQGAGSALYIRSATSRQ
jgi:acyl carrier protein phosphodiesterase